MCDLVSIIIPIYNMQDLIEDSLKSIQKQTYDNIEIILVDDGSTDNSLDVCRRLSNEDKRITIMHTENQGSGPARNVGILASKGKYLYFPDADDYLNQNAISILVEAAEDGKYDLIVFGYNSKTRHGDLVLEKTYERFINYGDFIRNNYSDYFGMDSRYSIQGAPWNKFFNGDIIRKNKIEYPQIRRHQDEAFISRYVCHSNKIKFIPDILYTYYPNTVSLEWEKYPDNYEECVLDLYNIWNDTICSWNKNDIKTHEKVNAEYLSKMIKALELSFSPKLKLGFLGKIQKIKHICIKSKISKIKYSVAGSLYQKLLLFFSKHYLYVFMLFLLYVGTKKNELRQGK